MTTDGFPSWSFGRRFLWMRREGRALSIQVRDGVGPLPPLPPEPVYSSPERQPKHLDLDTAMPCPHCGHDAIRYRQLSDGTLVCLGCGRSFLREEHWRPRGAR